MKRLMSFLFVSVLCLYCVVPSFAAEAAVQRSQETVASVTEEDLGNGFTMKTVIVVQKVNARSVQSSTQTRTAKKTSTVEHNGDRVGSMTLTANFGYNGSSAWVNSMSTGHSMTSGWTYEDEQTWKSGGTANMSAVMAKKLGSITLVSVEPQISISCSSTGQIS